MVIRLKRIKPWKFEKHHLIELLDPKSSTPCDGEYGLLGLRIVGTEDIDFINLSFFLN